MPCVEVMYRLVKVLFCLSAGRKLVERANVVFEVLVIVSEAKIPAWTGTRPHVTTTMAVEAQKTAQCLVYIRMPS